jgi:hypothetical protein
MAKLNKKFVAPKQPGPVVEADTSNVYTMELDRLLSDAKYDEKDFAILISQKLPKLSLEQSLILRALAVSFCRHGAGKAPKPEPVVKSKSNAAEKIQARMARDARALAALAEAKEEVKSRFLMTITPDMTMDQLWTICGKGQKLGKKGDKSLVVDNYTKGQLAKAGLGLIE